MLAAPTDDRTADTVRVGEFALTLQGVVPGDMAAVLALHTRVFGPQVDARWFVWKYGSAAQQGRGQAVGAWHGSELIAYCGGLPRTLWQQGQSRRGLQIGDVMVHPDWRGILTRRGPFFHVSRRFYESRLGAAQDRPFQLGFGFPNERHLRLAVKLGLLRDAGAIEALHWNTAPAATLCLPWNWRWQALLPTDAQFDRTINTAWQSMLAQAGGLTLGQRDAAYLRWRYVDRPASVGLSAGAPVRYRFFTLRRPWSTRSAGVAVLDLRSTSAHWLDWVGPLELLPLASRACRLEAARAGASGLTAWASAAVAQQLEHSGIARREVCARLGIPEASSLGPQDVPESGWWLMGGDTDFL